MISEFKSEFLRTKLKKHPKIDFVYYCDTGFLCAHHLNQTFMNKGAMKQHLRGKAHKINFDTGEPIENSGIPREILMQLQSLNKVETKPSSDQFWELSAKLDQMFPGNLDVKNEILSHHGFDGMIKYDIQKQIKSEMKRKELKIIWRKMGWNPDDV